MTPVAHAPNRSLGAAVVVLVALLVAPGGGAQEAPSFLHTTIQASVVVKDPDVAAQQIASWAEAQRGYFLERSPQQVTVRFPGVASSGFRNMLDEVAEFVVDYAPAARDLRQDFLRVEAGISSRQEMLDLTLSFMADADIVGTLALEAQVNELVTELELLRGERNRIALDRAFASATVALRAQQQTVPDKRPSSFAWINTVDLYRLLAESEWLVGR